MTLGQAGLLPVIRRDVPGPFMAALVFRAGVRFATFRTLPVPHLAEHLVMAGVPRTHLDVNALVDEDSMIFHAAGERSEVLDFLGRVATQINSPALHRLEHEARVVTLEGGAPVPPPVASTAVTRYGFRGVGLVGVVDGPRADQIVEQQVRDFMQRHLVAQNGALVVTGALPDDFALELPSGPKPALPIPVGDVYTGPSLVRSTDEDVTLSFELPIGEPAVVLVGGLLERAVEEVLRYRLGVVYDVMAYQLRVTDDRSLGVLSCQPGDAHMELVANELLTQLKRMALSGPTAEELAIAVRIEHDLLGDPWAAFGLAQSDAEALLARGRLPLSTEEARAELARIDAAAVRAVLRHALQRPLLEVPATTKIVIDGLTDRTEDTWDPGPVRHKTVFARRLLSLAPLDARAGIDDVGISLTLGGTRLGATWDQVVGVQVDGRDRIIAGADGRTLLIVGGWFRESDRLLACIDQRCASLLFGDQTERDVDSRSVRARP